MSKMVQKSLLVVAIVGVGLCVVVLIAAYRQLPRTPEEALQRFLSTEDRAEEQLMDPLILAGAKVVPLLVERVRSPAMPRRRYAILALGNIGDPGALAVLQEILKSPSEEGYVRGDALQAIALIDRDLGRRLALEYEQQGIEYLSDLSREVLSEKALQRRTFIQALRQSSALQVGRPPRLGSAASARVSPLACSPETGLLRQDILG